METKYYAMWNMDLNGWVTARRTINGRVEIQHIDKPLPLPFEDLRQWILQDWWICHRLSPNMSMEEINTLIRDLGWIIKEVDVTQILREKHAMKYL